MADINSDLNLKNARWFAKELGNFSPQEQGTLLRTEDFGEFEKILFDKGILNSIGLWQGRIDWQNQAAQGVRIPIATGKAPSAKIRLDEKNPVDNQGRISKALGRSPATKLAPIARTPIPASIFPGTLPPNNPREDQAPDNRGFRNRIRSIGPRQIRNRIIKRVRNRALSSKIGQKL